MYKIVSIFLICTGMGLICYGLYSVVYVRQPQATVAYQPAQSPSPQQGGAPSAAANMKSPPPGSFSFYGKANPERVAILQPGESIIIAWLGGNIRPNTPGYTADYQPNPVHGFGVVSSFTGVLAKWVKLPYKEKSLHSTLVVIDGGTKEVKEFDAAAAATIKNTQAVPITVSLLYNDLPEYAPLHVGAEYFSIKKFKD